MNEKTATGARLVLGFMFSAGAIAGILGKVPPPEPEAAQAFMGMLASSGLIFIVKILELLCGIALLSGRFVPCTSRVGSNRREHPVLSYLLGSSGAPVGVFFLVLWIVAGLGQRSTLLPLLAHAREADAFIDSVGLGGCPLRRNLRWMCRGRS